MEKGREYMEKYIGVKIIHAKPMTRGAYNIFKGWNIPPDENPADEGYQVKYSDDYISWSPRGEFEKSYRKTDGLTFGLAVEALKKGFKVSRKSWGGYWKIEKLDILSEPTIVAYCKDGSIQAATPYQCDILAEDWMIID